MNVTTPYIPNALSPFSSAVPPMPSVPLLSCPSFQLRIYSSKHGLEYTDWMRSTLFGPFMDDADKHRRGEEFFFFSLQCHHPYLEFKLILLALGLEKLSSPTRKFKSDLTPLLTASEMFMRPICPTGIS
jgi:hypothetical protein